MTIVRSFRVLDDAVSYPLLVEALEEMGLQCHERLGVDGTSETREEVWANKAGTVAINYVEDAFSGQRYVSIREDESCAVLEDFTRRVMVYWPGELLERVWMDLPREEMIDTLFRVAITFVEFEEDAAEALFDKAINHPDPNVRAAALQSIGLRAWPEMRQVVEHVASGPKSDMQELAQKILDRWPE